MYNIVRTWTVCKQGPGRGAEKWGVWLTTGIVSCLDDYSTQQKLGNKDPFVPVFFFFKERCPTLPWHWALVCSICTKYESMLVLAPGARGPSVASMCKPYFLNHKVLYMQQNVVPHGTWHDDLVLLKHA